MEELVGGVGLKEYSAKILEKTVYFQVIRLEKSFFLWIGTSPSMKSLAVAMPTRFVSIVHLVTCAVYMIFIICRMLFPSPHN